MTSPLGNPLLYTLVLSILIAPDLVGQQARDAGSAPQESMAATRDVSRPFFVDRTQELGIEFEHRIFATGEKYMPENMGAGVAVLDVDQDGRLDLFFVQGAPVAPAQNPQAAANSAHQLYRQDSSGRFRNESQRLGARSGEPDSLGVGMGVCFGDLERDGDLDLYVTHYGPDVLYRNRGDGTFEDATSELGLGNTAWSSGCTFFDADQDGDLDLYVVAYVDFSLGNHKYCGNARKKLRSYCHPDVYAAAADSFYRNDGARFSDRSRAAGILPTAATRPGIAAGLLPTSDAKGLGVAAADFDGDGDQDLVVANDSTMNHFYLGDGKGVFEESALFAGVGFNASGAAEAGMGVVVADLDQDLRPDLLLTHLDQETNTFFRNAGDGLFVDRSDASGLAAPSLPWVAFGAVALDADLDGDLDLAVVNGHIIDNIAVFDARRQHAQPPQFFEHRGGRFVEVQDALGSGLLVGRGLVAADLDGDGDEDLVLTQNNGPAKVLINTRGDQGRSLKLRFQSTKSAAHGLGSHVVFEIGDERLLRLVPNAGSYLSQGPPEILLGLGPKAEVDAIEVHWASGRISRHKDFTGPLVTLQEPPKEAQ